MGRRRGRKRRMRRRKRSGNILRAKVPGEVSWHRGWATSAGNLLRQSLWAKSSRKDSRHSPWASLGAEVLKQSLHAKVSGKMFGKSRWHVPFRPWTEACTAPKPFAPRPLSRQKRKNVERMIMSLSLYLMISIGNGTCASCTNQLNNAI